MGTLTGTYLQATCQVLLGEMRSTTAQQQDVLYPNHIQRTANEIARAAYGVFLHAAGNVASGDGTVIMPYAPLEVRQMSVFDVSGNLRPLEYITPPEAEMLFLDYHALDPAAYTGVPEYYLVETATNIKLFPIPNYSLTNGIIVSAYWGVDQWWDQTTPCPLPETFDDLLTNGICYRRCLEMISLDPTYSTKLPVFQQTYMQGLAAVREEAMRYTDSRRGGTPNPLGSAGAMIAANWYWWA